MNYLLNILIGFTFSIAATCPGLSESAIAVMWGVYDKLILNVSNLTNSQVTTQDKVKSFIWLVFIGIGFIIGYVIFAKLLSFLMVLFPKELSIVFIGFVLGIIPSLLKYEIFGNKKEQTSSSWFYMFLGFAIIIIIVLIKWWFNIDTSHHSASELKHFHIDVTWQLCLTLFVVAFVSGTALALPGLSGALLMMILGQYFNILGMVSNIISSHFLYVIPLMSFAFGVVASFLLTSRIMEKLLETHKQSVMNFITGLIFGSVFAIFAGVPSTTFNFVVSIILSIFFFTAVHFLMENYSYKDK